MDNMEFFDQGEDSEVILDVEMFKYEKGLCVGIKSFLRMFEKDFRRRFFNLSLSSLFCFLRVEGESLICDVLLMF